VLSRLVILESNRVMVAMKSFGTLFLALAFAGSPAVGHASAGTLMARVVSLLTEMEARIEADGKGEQKSYHKFVLV